MKTSQNMATYTICAENVSKRTDARLLAKHCCVDSENSNDGIHEKQDIHNRQM